VPYISSEMVYLWLEFIQYHCVSQDHRLGKPNSIEEKGGYLPATGGFQEA
jgi:hypothetical protein